MITISVSNGKVNKQDENVRKTLDTIQDRRKKTGCDNHFCIPQKIQPKYPQRKRNKKSKRRAIKAYFSRWCRRGRVSKYTISPLETGDLELKCGKIELKQKKAHCQVQFLPASFFCKNLAFPGVFQIFFYLRSEIEKGFKTCWRHLFF